MNIAIIPARGQSKRIPKKNIKNFFGKPLIAWSIEAAQRSGLFDHIIVSTDCKEIAEVAKNLGAEVPFMRPSELSDDYVATGPVIKHALQWGIEHLGQIDFVCTIYATAPFITSADLVQGLSMLVKSGRKISFTVTTYPFPIQRALKIMKHGDVVMFQKRYYKTRSQDLEVAYHDAAQFYFATPDAVLNDLPVFSHKSLPLILPRHKVQDIDTFEDFSVAESMYAYIQSQKKRVSKLCIGTAQFGMQYGIANQTGQIDSHEAQKILQLASANGIHVLDTARAYGESEATLGKIGVKDYNVVTKLFALPDDCTNVGEWVKEQIAVSLSLLGVAKLYGLLLHRPEQLLGLNGKKLYQALQYLKESGVVQKIGVSIYAPSQLDELIHQYQFDIVQAPFNIMDQRLKTTGWLYKLKDHDCELHVRSVFLQGLLLTPFDAIPSKFLKWRKLWKKWYSWLSQENISPIRACISFLLTYQEIDKFIVGVDSTSQLQEIIIASGSDIVHSKPDFHVEDEMLLNPSYWSQL